MIKAITNYVQLTEKIATSGQLTEEQFGDIAQHGYRAVINLAMPDSTGAMDNEGAIVTSHGLSYFHIPVPFDAPGKEHLAVFLKLMAALEGERVWVHCAKNYRVSAFMFHHQKWMHGLSTEEARPIIYKDWRPDKVWQAFLSIDVNDV